VRVCVHACVRACVRARLAETPCANSTANVCVCFRVYVCHQLTIPICVAVCYIFSLSLSLAVSHSSITQFIPDSFICVTHSQGWLCLGCILRVFSNYFECAYVCMSVCVFACVSLRADVSCRTCDWFVCLNSAVCHIYIRVPKTYLCTLQYICMYIHASTHRSQCTGVIRSGVQDTLICLCLYIWCMMHDMYICMYIHVTIYMYIYTCIYIHMHRNYKGLVSFEEGSEIYLSMHTFIYNIWYINICVFIYIYTCTHTYTHTHTDHKGLVSFAEKSETHLCTETHLHIYIRMIHGTYIIYFTDLCTFIYKYIFKYISCIIHSLRSRRHTHVQRHTDIYIYVWYMNMIYI